MLKKNQKLGNMKLKTIHLDNKIKEAQQELEQAYKIIAERKAYIRILKILKTKINEN